MFIDPASGTILGSGDTLANNSEDSGIRQRNVMNKSSIYKRSGYIRETGLEEVTLQVCLAGEAYGTEAGPIGPCGPC